MISQPFLLIPHEISDSLYFLGLSQNEFKTLLLIIRCTHGVRLRKNTANYNRVAVIRPTDLTLVDIPIQQAAKVLKNLADKELIVWDRQKSEVRLNLETVTAKYSPEKLKKLISNNLNKLELMTKGMVKEEIIKPITINPAIMPSESKEVTTQRNNKEIQIKDKEIEKDYSNNIFVIRANKIVEERKNLANSKDINNI